MIYISNKQDITVINIREIKRIANNVLISEGCKHRDLSLVFVDNLTIRGLNKRFLGRNCSTDVLAFPLQEDNLLGEVVISAEKAKIEAKKRKIPFKEELFRYCIHGILHLLGYNDERTNDRKKMWTRQEELLNKYFRRRKIRL